MMYSIKPTKKETKVPHFIITPGGERERESNQRNHETEIS